MIAVDSSIWIGVNKNEYFRNTKNGILILFAVDLDDKKKG